MMLTGLTEENHLDKSTWYSCCLVSLVKISKGESSHLLYTHNIRFAQGKLLECDLHITV